MLPRKTPTDLRTFAPTHNINNKRPRVEVAAAELPTLTLRLRRAGSFGLAEVACTALAPRTGPLRLVIAIDKSGSMELGARRANALSGLHALLTLLQQQKEEESVVTILGFDDDATVVFGPGTPAEALDGWSRFIEPGLCSGGGTNIADALDTALAACEADAATAVLLLTDGEDVDLRRSFRHADCPLRLRLGRLPSGVGLHMVGICQDADCILLDDIAKAAHNGTFTSIGDADIGGLMGSLLGLLLEQVPQTCRIGGRTIVVRVGTPTLVPLVLTDIFGVEQGFSLRVFRLGGDDVQMKLDACFEVSKEDDDDIIIILAHAREWHGRAKDIVARALARGELEVAKTALASVRDRLLPAWLAASPSLRELAGEIAREQEELDASDADLRGLAARAASEAATVRNGGVSIGGGASESMGQRAMRSMSLVYS